ncbi:MAG: DUF5309 family protein [Desulfosarcina sp.]|nr:DUF5309 family protein [Desulfosarcina sp.]MBC2764499.1 DUF5309 domain-containing protein [Desulfosarcina sp.]
MPTILGLRDVANFTSDERPKDWREMILRLYPRSEQKAPLNALIAGMKREPAVDAEFNWFEKDNPSRKTAINYSTGYNTTVTSVAVDSSAPFRADDLVLNTTTDEVMRVTTDPTAGTTLVFARGWGSTKAAITDNDELVVIGTAIAEGATARSSKYTDPNKKYNYTQIFRHPLKLTNTAKATKLRTGKAVAEMKREALDDHTADMERGMFFGVRNEDLTGNEPKRSTGGILSFLSTNVTSVSGGNLTYAAWNTFLMGLFAYGAGEKICFCGNHFLKVINDMAEARGQINMTANTDVYGIAVVKWVTPFGTVYFKNHPLFNEVTIHGKTGVFLELKHVIYRPLKNNGENRDTQYLKNRQARDADCTLDEFLTEMGLEVQNEKRHGVLKNVNAYTA